VAETAAVTSGGIAAPAETVSHAHSPSRAETTPAEKTTRERRQTAGIGFLSLNICSS
jgi:hypothetical protein